MKFYRFSIGETITIKNSERLFECPVIEPTELELKFWKFRYMTYQERPDHLDYKSLLGIEQCLNEPGYFI